MILPETVVRRFTAAQLTEEWVDSVEAEFNRLTSPRVTDYRDVLEALEKLRDFVRALEKDFTIQSLTLEKTNIDGIKLLAKGLTETCRTFHRDMQKSDFQERLQRFLPDFRKGLETEKYADILYFDTRKWIFDALRDDAQQIKEFREDSPELWDDEVFQEFDIHGMKVVIDDSSLHGGKIKLYIKYLKEAYNLLRAKGLGKAWYGTIFIQCQDCIESSDNQYQINGRFLVKPDTVMIFIRPSKRMVQTLIHELGHRYWFKQMSKAQRDHFTDLVQLDTPFDLHAVTKWVKSEVEQFLDKDLDEDNVPSLRATLDDIWLDRVTSCSDYIVGYYDKKTELERIEIEKRLKDAYGSNHAKIVNLLRDGNGTYKDFKNLTQKWMDAILGEAIQIAKELERPVLPVSEYGHTNIDEAFAEVFAYYVMEYHMTREQSDSFKYVIKMAGTSWQDTFKAVLGV